MEVVFIFTPFKRGPGASSRLAHLAVCCRHRCLGRQPKKSGKTLQMGVVTAQASLGLASCPRGHPSSVHSEHSRRRRGANGEARPVTLRCCPLRCSPPASSTNSTAERLGSAGGATRGLCCGHLGRLGRGDVSPFSSFMLPHVSPISPYISSSPFGGASLLLRLLGRCPCPPPSDLRPRHVL